MNEIITEKNYPVQGLWVFKSILGSLLGLIILVSYFWLSRFSESKDSEISFYIPLIIIFAIFHFVVTILRRATFHYSIEGAIFNFATRYSLKTTAAHSLWRNPKSFC